MDAVETRLWEVVKSAKSDIAIVTALKEIQRIHERHEADAELSKNKVEIKIRFVSPHLKEPIDNPADGTNPKPLGDPGTTNDN